MENGWKNGWKSRKFLISVALMACSTVAMFLGRMSPGEWTIAVGGLYAWWSGTTSNQKIKMHRIDKTGA